MSDTDTDWIALIKRNNEELESVKRELEETEIALGKAAIELGSVPNGLRYRVKDLEAKLKLADRTLENVLGALLVSDLDLEVRRHHVGKINETISKLRGENE